MDQLSINGVTFTLEDIKELEHACNSASLASKRLCDCLVESVDDARIRVEHYQQQKFYNLWLKLYNLEKTFEYEC